MLLLTFSAALVGFVHSLSPGHWIPVVLMAKARKWNIQTVLLGALTAASGHIFISVVVGGTAAVMGAHYLVAMEEDIEKYTAVGVSAFGFLYAAFAYWRHHQCRGHSHHGPVFTKNQTPFLFLFSLGFSPCVAVLPVFLAAVPQGMLAVGSAMVAFSFGVVASLCGAAVLVMSGLSRAIPLDHPFLEHYGDVLTGLMVALMGILLLFLPH